jgi:SAM-dependent MidA family methyltransferase
VRWVEMNELELAPLCGMVFSNEFIDALPVHRARYANGVIDELYVTAVSDGGITHLSFVWDHPSDGRLTEYIRRMDVVLREGQEVEINLDAVDWLSRVARLLEKGFLITIDYGDSAPQLYTPDRRSGTVRSFHHHRLIDSPLDRVGEQDITTSVNFTALIDYGADFGFDLVSFERQTAFLIRMGLVEKIASMYDPSDSLDDLKDRLAVKNLFVPGGVSDSFRVLIQKR